ncbi:MAG: T9SS type A sorting domain-containing protein [Bacteroidales bacterium]|nr:T9SS type A sorting domain-containing protein [Bacteroidales bacterium]
MIKNIFIIILILLSEFSFSQDTVAKWTFSQPSPSVNNDGGSADNKLKKLASSTTGGSIYFVNGLTTSAAAVDGWIDPVSYTYWYVEFSTMGYENLYVFSKLSSDPLHPGPKDFIVKYKVGACGPWTDIANDSLLYTPLTVAADWTTGVVDSLNLPSGCDNIGLVYVGWFTNSDTATDGSVLLSTGVSIIDDIFITGTANGYGVKNIETNKKCSIYPNPTDGKVRIISNSEITKTEIYDMLGNTVFTDITNTKEFDLSVLTKGIYFAKVFLKNDKVLIDKIILK